ncbi:MAG: hypothetical protein AAF628_37530 [Planctomycetota bacterium]
MKVVCGIVLLFLAVGTPAQDCRSCSDQGLRECKKHRGLLAQEREVEFCSVAAACRTCAGALAADCKRCDDPATQGELESRQALVAAWVAARRARIDEHATRGEILHARTAHVDLAFSIRPLMVGKKKLDSHRLMHLYLERIEALHARFCQVFGIEDSVFSTRLQLFVFHDRDDHRVIAPREAGGGGEALGMKLMGNSAVYSMWHDRRLMRSDEELFRNLVHNVTHLLVSNMPPQAWLGNRGSGWLDEGISHWFEDALTGKCTTFCYEEVGQGLQHSFGAGEWRVPLRKLLEAGKLEPFAAVSLLNTDQMNGRQRMQSFAYVDFLLQEHGGEALRRLVEQRKADLPLRNALRDATGLTVLNVDPKLADWMRAHYPLERGDE